MQSLLCMKLRVALACLILSLASHGRTVLAADIPSVLRPDNQVAWCIVPFDAKKRSPAERAVMLKELGIKRCAYDWRDEHVPTFEQEIIEYKKHGIEFFAFWSVHEEAFKLFEKYDLHPQIWVMFGTPNEASQDRKVESAAQQLLALAKRTKSMGCKLGLYNHGGWSGDPENMVAVCKRLHELDQDHVGIVYNFHHGHAHIENWSKWFALMQPYLICLNLNGMNAKEDPKILGIGKGTHELEMIRTVVESGYQGPIGIIDHRDELDARESLLENRDGLEWVQKEIEKAGSGGPKPGTKGDVSVHEMPYDGALVTQLIAEAQQLGDPIRGASVYADVKLACISCHRVGDHGGVIGPALSSVAKDRTPEHIVESILWPKRDVKPEFATWKILTSDGRVFTGYKQSTDGKMLTLRDPSSDKLTSIAIDDIEEEVAGSTVMPSGLTGAMSRQQQLDLILFLLELGREGQPVSEELKQAIAHSQMRGPATFPFENQPLCPSNWSHWNHHVNRNRIFDYYSKQAEYFRKQTPMPMLLGHFPGLDGGTLGHWGNQSEKDWTDARWKDSDLGSVQAGVFRAEGITVARGVCARIGEDAELSACFNPDTLNYEAVWSGGFLSFEEHRHGFNGGVIMDGVLQAKPDRIEPKAPFRYHGFYRHDDRVVFAYRIGDVEYLDSPWVKDNQFFRDVAPAHEHSLRQFLEGGPTQWPEVLETEITAGSGKPYAVDTIEMPRMNPWKSLMYLGDHDFLADGTALVCTMQGDVWRVTGLNAKSEKEGVARWKRFASGLHHALGLVVDDGNIYVQCRDQLTRLTDLNDDGEADFYECFSNAFVTSPAGHDFICGLQQDDEGNFYMASGNQGLVRISPDGRTAEAIATGFRNPDGLGILPDGTLTVPVSEGEWTPASAIHAVRNAARTQASEALHHGYRGPKNGKPPELPIVYLPRALDNSSGGQAFVESESFGPLRNQLLHVSFGTGCWFVVLRDEIDGQTQGAIVPMTGDFSSGSHRIRLSPLDGQMYVTGMTGWGSYTKDEGCFQRVRYTGDPVQVPTGFHTHENGIRITFSLPIDVSIASDAKQHFAQCWNYRYSEAYGSLEYSTSHPGVPGHDPLEIASVQILPDGRSLFLEIPELQPVNVLHLRLHVNADDSLTCSPTGQGHDLFVTVHKLDKPFTDFAGYKPRVKTIAAHPLLGDMATNTAKAANPWRQKIEKARAVAIETGTNLTYVTREFSVRANEPLAITLKNPDVVPHNWVLVKPDSLQTVGELSNQLIARPDAFARQYIPDTEDVIAYTDIVSPTEKQTIYIQAPSEPGHYPFLCTFPGHWMVMNGTMIVE
jgi:putative heme-binding domain-containing protein